MKVRIYSTLNGGGTQIRETSSSNWKEFRTELEAAGIYVDPMNAVVRENGLGFASDDAQLPTGIGRNAGQATSDWDFTLVLTPSKMKSGNTVNLNEVEASFELFRSELHASIDSQIDDLIDSLNDDGLDIEQANTYENSVNERVATVSSRTPEEEDLANFAASIR